MTDMEAVFEALDARPGWAAAALGDLTDLVVVLDSELRLMWVNEHTRQLLGYIEHEVPEVIGQSIAEFVHPDDLLRAGEVVGMMVEEKLVVSVTPALYRVRRADGSWLPIELNGSVVRGAGDLGELIVIVGRYSGDRALQDRILEMLTGGSSTDDVVSLIPEFGHWRHPYEVYAIWYTNERGDRVMVGTDLAADLAAAGGGPDSPWEVATRRNEDVIVGPDDLPPAVRALAEERALGSCWAMPVPDPLHSEPAVAIAWSSADSGLATPVHRYALETMTRALTLVLQWRRQRTGLENAARRDSLTGVANRARIFELLGELHDSGAAAAGRDGATPVPVPVVGLLYIDLDGFKDVNDLHGHTAGDAVLTEVVRRIGGVLRPGDLLGRLGGDEFAVVCLDVTEDDSLAKVASRIIESLARPMRVGRQEMTVGASIGIATSPADALEPDELVDRADHALYKAKASGRGRWQTAASEA